MTMVLLLFSSTVETASTSHPSQTPVSNVKTPLMSSRAEIIHSRLPNPFSKAMSTVPTSYFPFLPPTPAPAQAVTPLHTFPTLSYLCSSYAVSSRRVILHPFCLLKSCPPFEARVLSHAFHRSTQSPVIIFLSFHCPLLSWSYKDFGLSVVYCGCVGKPLSASPRGSLPSIISVILSTP